MALPRTRTGKDRQRRRWKKNSSSLGGPTVSERGTVRLGFNSNQLSTPQTNALTRAPLDSEWTAALIFNEGC